MISSFLLRLWSCLSLSVACLCSVLGMPWIFPATAALSFAVIDWAQRKL